MLDVLASVLEIATLVAVLAALVVVAVILGHPWGWPVALVAVALTSGAALVAVRARVEAMAR